MQGNLNLNQLPGKDRVVRLLSLAIGVKAVGFVLLSVPPVS